MNPVIQYIDSFEPHIRERLHAIRNVFIECLPEFNECIRYNMPAFKTGEYHLHFAGYKNHIGFYPVGHSELEDEVAPFRAKNTKDSLHFPHDKPLPLSLISQIILLKSKL